MGILNVTPDSFSDGGRFLEVGAAVARGLAMLDEGADLLDIGGESTRPQAVAISARAEQDRIGEVIRTIARTRPEAVISIDTYHASTARMAVRAGAGIVNDVSGGLWDKEMLGVCAEMGCGVILMHTRGRPGDWAGLPGLAPREVASLVRDELAARVDRALEAGVARESIVLDPGFGFGKRGRENYALLAGLGEVGALRLPVLAGVSRKGFLMETIEGLGGRAVAGLDERMMATVAANTAAVLTGAHVLRVHDVRAALLGAAVADALLEGLGPGPDGSESHARC